ncbi:MAG: hypothetical protein C4589_12525 [Peptococcaceae bacterium]|nr:MAG: hypothetical protein C4589_12525 [Peptococcaceae bacterium]
MENLKKLIVYFVAKFRKVGSAELNRVLASFEETYFRLYRKSFLEVKFHETGKDPYVRVVLDAIEELKGVVVNRNFTYYGIVQVLYVINNKEMADKIIQEIPGEAKMAAAMVFNFFESKFLSPGS